VLAWQQAAMEAEEIAARECVFNGARDLAFRKEVRLHVRQTCPP
jgi:Zn ribbon nucleic-acid-binding protein